MAGLRGLRGLLAGNRDFRLVLSAGLISLTGDWVLRAGLTYLVYDLTGSTAASAATVLASLLPQLAFGSVAGVFADRWDRRRTMVVTNVLLAAALLPLLAVNGPRQVWIVYLVTAVHSGLAQFFVAAEAAVIPALVPAADLLSANALNGQNQAIARLVGAALGGVLAGVGGITLLAATDALSFVVAAALLFLVQLKQPRAATTPRRRLAREWAAGVRIALRSPTLRVVLAFVLVTGAGEAIMATLMAPFVRDVLGGDAGAYGLIMSVQAAGGIVGGLIAAAVGPRFRPRRLVGWAAVAFGVLDLVLFLYPLAYPRLWPAFVIMIVVGLPGALTIAALITIVQGATGDEYRGRVMGAATTVQATAMLAGSIVAGALGGRLGIIPVIALQGAGYCVAGLLALLFLPREPADRRPRLRVRRLFATADSRGHA